jgi:hypothetical protein
MRRRAVLAAEILAAYARARWLVARRPLPEAVAALRRAGETRAASPADPVAEGRRLGRAVDRLLRPMPTDTRCLSQALTLTRLLAARRMGGTLVIGVAGGDDFEAHAWVELDGRPLLPSGDGRYARLTEL